MGPRVTANRFASRDLSGAEKGLGACRMGFSKRSHRFIKRSGSSNREPTKKLREGNVFSSSKIGICRIPSGSCSLLCARRSLLDRLVALWLIPYWEFVEVQRTTDGFRGGGGVAGGGDARSRGA